MTEGGKGQNDDCNLIRANIDIHNAYLLKITNRQKSP